MATVIEREKACMKQDADPQVALLQLILGHLDGSGCRYALLHHADDLAQSVDSDIDLALDEDPRKVMWPILERVARSGRANVVQCLHYDVPRGYYFILELADIHHFLHLDCIHDPIGVNRYRLATPFLLDGATEEAPAHRPAAERGMLYRLVKRAVKGSVSVRELAALQSDARSLPASFWPLLEQWFGSRGRQTFDAFIQSSSSADANRELERLRGSFRRTFRIRHPIRRALAWSMDSWRKLCRLLRPTGLFVVLVGPDGSGKSSARTFVSHSLKRAFRHTWHFHWRPGLLPKLRRGMNVRVGPGAGPSDEQRRSSYGRIVSAVRFVYYWLDFVLGYWLVIYPRRAQTTLILGERYFADVLVDQDRYGFDVPRWLLRTAVRFVPRPDLLILLSDRPEAIHARKDELPIDVIARQLSEYRAESRHWGNAAVIEGVEGVESVGQRISRLILAECARRTARRAGIADLEWRAFPSATNPKVFIGTHDNAAVALNLYHPYSRSGSLAKSVLCSLPAGLQRALLRQRAGTEVTARLSSLTYSIRRRFGNEAALVSFSAGTQQPHRKLTAQVGDGARVFGYVKIGANPREACLLRNEAQMLARLRTEASREAVLPTVQGIEQIGSETLLYLSAPANPGRQRPVELDDKDFRFLAALGALDAAQVPVSTFFSSLGLNESIRRIHESDPHAAVVLRDAAHMICEIMEPAGIATCVCHGDYAPWNTLDLDDGSLYVFDWEQASMDGPALGDLMHRIVMPARLVLRRTSHSIVDSLLQLDESEIAKPLLLQAGISHETLPAYVLLYLLAFAVKHDAVDDISFATACMRQALKTMGHPRYRRNVLVSAYACEPHGGSEPGVGWNVCEAISVEHDAWVITRKNNREAIETALAERPNPHLHFSYTDLPRWASRWKKGTRGIRTYYYLWQFAAWREAKRLRRNVTFDLAHHVTFVNDWLFTSLAFLSLPFVWGPIGSHPKMPRRLATTLSVLLKDRARCAFQAVMRVVDPLFWVSIARATVIVGINDGVGTRFPVTLLGKHKFFRQPAIGVEDVSDASFAHDRHRDREVRVLSMGRLVPMKGFHLALPAFAKAARVDARATLTIVGKGREKATLQKLALDLGISERVTFIDWLPRDEALAYLRESDIFLFPSSEGGGMVVLEAMAHGLPVVTLNYGGPGEIVNVDCGFAIEPAALDETVEGLSAALTTLVSDREVRRRMGAAARKRVEEAYLWGHRHEAIRRWYSVALATSASENCGSVAQATVDKVATP